MPKAAAARRAKPARSAKSSAARSKAPQKARKAPKSATPTRAKASVPQRKPALPSSAGKVSTLRMFTVDAFTRRPFHGNPAAVVLLDKSWLPTDVMQTIATENNLSETAFVIPKGGAGKFAIRWFTPTTEVDLCGHATLAAAFALWQHAGAKGNSLVFESASGKLPVERRGDMIVLDFPARPAKRTGISRHLSAALGREPSEVYQAAAAGSPILAVFENKRDVHELSPDFAKLRELDAPTVIVTAPGAGHDYVCRFFAPSHGVEEDPVTGSAQCVLAPYWASRLGKTLLSAHQVSRRGGELFCELVGTRVRIGGHAVTFAHAEISVPIN